MRCLVLVLVLVACASPVLTLRNQAPVPANDPLVDMTGFAYFWRCGLRRSGAISCRSLFDLAPPNHVVELDGSCARTSDGRVECTNGVDPFHEIRDVGEATAIASSFDTSCAIRRDQSVACWASDEEAVAYDVPGLASVQQLAVDGRACAVTVDGSIWCWTGRRRHPHWVRELSSAVEVAVTRASACARLRDGTVSCWGINDHGELGDGTTERRETPRVVPGVDRVLQVRAFAEAVCALRDDGSVWCWGGRAASHHGERPRPRRCTVPTQVVAVRNTAWIWMTLDTLCAVDTDGRRTCLSDSPREASLYGATSTAHWLDGCVSR